MILSKPPSAICFQSFIEKSNIGCSSSNIYDIVAFLSIMPNTDNKLVLATKIKQRWRISSMNKLISNGEKLCKLMVNCRLIILERVRTCDNNFIYAITQCYSINITNIEENDFKTCKTLRDAAKLIENKLALTSLYNILSSHFISYYKCLKCKYSTDSLSTTHKCTSIYEPHIENSSPYAVPLTWQDTINLQCSVCNEKTKNVILPIYTQVHHQYSSILMYHSSRTTLRAVTNLRIELNNHITRCKYIYEPLSALLIDEYNAISVIKLKNNVIYCKSPYQTTTSLSNDEINELFHTAEIVIIFLHQVDDDDGKTSSSMNTQQTDKQQISTQQMNNQSITAATYTLTLLKSPLVVRLINAATGTSLSGTIMSLTIPQTVSIKSMVNDTRRST